MIKKVVFFLSWPLDQRNFNRFGADILQKNGFEVIFFDFTPIIYPIVHANKNISDTFQYKKLYYFFNKKDGIQSILKLTKECVLIVLFPCERETFWIYKALKKTEAHYAISVTNAVPNLNINSKSQNLLERLTNSNLQDISKYIFNIPFRPIFSKYLGIRAPKFWLAGGEKSPGNYFNSYLLNNETEILWLHTLDYDIYLENSSCQSQNISNKAVFIAGPGPLFLRDELIQGRSTLSKERYFPSLCSFFNKVEQTLNVRIEIAAHAGSNYESHPIVFGERLTIRGNIFQMINQARFVITHASTAINFAVLLKKPIIFITTDEYESVPIDSLDIKSMASRFKKRPINIDHSFNVDWEKELSIDKYCYDKFENDYIKKKGSEKLNSWQIFSNRIKKL